MPLQSIVRGHWLKWGLFWGAWALLALWQAVARYLFRANTGDPISWWRALSTDALDQGSWALLALAAFWLSTRFPLDRGNRRRNLTLHVAAGLVLIATRFWLVNYLVFWIGWAPQMVSGLIFFAVFSTNLVFYALMVGAAHGIDYYRRYRERELRTSQLEAGLARAELQVLKMQLHPHFLFNTLNTISALMHLNVAAADRMVARLGDLLRSTLETAGTQEVTLRDELAFLEPYLEIEQTRFGDRLKVEWNIHTEVLDAIVPHLILQPLIENAIRHGVAVRSGKGCIRISAFREGDVLQLEVRDDGPGLPTPGTPRRAGEGGVGLANTRARLLQLYDHRHRFELQNVPGGGASASLGIPFRTEADDIVETEMEVPSEGAHAGH